ncbi:hypothetical protein [Teichococcus aestuarii]
MPSSETPALLPTPSPATPRYQQIKAFILSRVASGEWGWRTACPPSMSW